MDISTQTLVGQTLSDPRVSASIAQLAAAALAAVLSVVATLLGKFIKTKLNAENSTWKQKIAYRLVCYAEQKIVDNAGRRQYVADQIHALMPKVSSEEAAHLIEEAVVQLRSVQAAPVIQATATASAVPSPAPHEPGQ